MKKFLLLIIIIVPIVFFVGCSTFNSWNNNLTTNSTMNSTVNTQSTIYDTICQDMDNVANVLRSLDVLYYEDYAITELNPIVGYKTYQQQSNYYGISNNSNEINDNEVPASSVNLANFNINYTYTPKYILDTSKLDTTFIYSYIQSLQDLFLITNDITAGNSILTNLTYNTINEALTVKNNAGLTNIASLQLTSEQNYTFNEFSFGINNVLNELKTSSGFIGSELDQITTIRDNYYKNIEALNVKYLTILNIIDSRVIQIQNLQQLIQRLNNQLLVLNNNSNSNFQNTTIMPNTNSNFAGNQNNISNNPLNQLIQNNNSNLENTNNCTNNYLTNNNTDNENTLPLINTNIPSTQIENVNQNKTINEDSYVPLQNSTN